MVERPTLELTLKPSRLLCGLIIGSHVIAAAMLARGSLPLLAVMVVPNALFMLFWNWWWLLRHHVRVRLAAEESGIIVDGMERSARLMDSSTVWGCFAVLHLRVESMRLVRTLILLPDAVGTEALRRLRVMARLRRA